MAEVGRVRFSVLAALEMEARLEARELLSICEIRERGDRVSICQRHTTERGSDQHQLTIEVARGAHLSLVPLDLLPRHTPKHPFGPLPLLPLSLCRTIEDDLPFDLDHQPQSHRSLLRLSLGLGQRDGSLVERARPVEDQLGRSQSGWDGRGGEGSVEEGEGGGFYEDEKKREGV